MPPKKGGAAAAPPTSLEKHTVLKDQPVRKTSKGKSDQTGIVKKGQIVVVEVSSRTQLRSCRRPHALAARCPIFLTLWRIICPHR